MNITWEELLTNKVEGSKFFNIRQSNSGGYSIINQDVSKAIVVEAFSVEEAEDKLKKITDNYDEYCSCCGERWSIWLNESDATEIPCVYDEPLNKRKGEWFASQVVVYFLNGSRFHVNTQHELIINTNHEIAYAKGDED